MATIDNIYPNIDLVFLKALNYPDFSRPEYFIKEQEKSGWSKGIFLRALMVIQEHFSMQLEMTTSAQKGKLKKEGRELPENFGLELEKESKGEVKGILTKKILEDLRYSIINAYRIGRQEPIFDSYQIIAYCERMFIYIRSQFNEQIKKTGNAWYLAERKRKEGQHIEGNPEYIIYHYNIISEAPVVDFQRFRNEVRKLLLNSLNPSELATMLKPLHTVGIEIVDLWNNHLQPIEVAANEEDLKKIIYDQRLITFDPEEMVIWTRNIYSPEDYYREPSKHFLNQDFVAFAAKVVNLISGEILKKVSVKEIQKLQQKEYEDFNDLFINPDHIIPCFELLRQEELIGEKSNYTGKLKSAFCLWANELRTKQVINYVPNELLTKLLNQKFEGLNMHSSNFRTPLTNASRKYKSKFSKAMDKLSQPSQF